MHDLSGPPALGEEQSTLRSSWKRATRCLDLGGRRHGGNSLRRSNAVPQPKFRLYPPGTESQQGRLLNADCYFGCPAGRGWPILALKTVTTLRYNHGARSGAPTVSSGGEKAARRDTRATHRAATPCRLAPGCPRLPGLLADGGYPERIPLPLAGEGRSRRDLSGWPRNCWNYPRPKRETIRQQLSGLPADS
jgi:hypothetical protein